MALQFELIAKTFMGLEPVLAKELTQLGASDVQIGRRMVSFTGDQELMYRANFQLHTAIRILKPIRHFKAKSADDVYEEIKKIDWTQYLGAEKTFAVDAVVFSEEFRHSKFVSYKVKDAIVDQLREKTGKRPNISISNPDIRLNMHIAEDKCTLSLDSSGESLHRRGYRRGHADHQVDLIRLEFADNLIEHGEIQVAVVIDDFELYILLRLDRGQTVLQVLHDLIQGSVVHEITDAYFEGLGFLGQGEGTQDQGQRDECGKNLFHDWNPLSKNILPLRWLVSVRIGIQPRADPSRRWMILA